MQRQLLRFLGLLALTVIPLAAASAAPLAAGTVYVVNTADDGDDGSCDAAHCSLREAITAANAVPGTDTITFNFAGAPPFSIAPSLPLPVINDPVVIDGTTQPGWNGTPIVELEGSQIVWTGSPTSITGGVSNTTYGLHITAGSSTVRGLVINRFDGAGIRLETGGSNLIEKNYLGTDTTGSVALGNQVGVLVVNSAANTIGRPQPGGNLIAGNLSQGVVISGTSSIGNLVQGNFIGTDATGTVSLGNATGVDVILGASNNIIGGNPNFRNVISGNQGAGVRLLCLDYSICSGNRIVGNRIGTSASGGYAVPNVTGIEIQGLTDGNFIGGIGVYDGNVIAGNTGWGIEARETNHLAIQGNYIGTNGYEPLGNGEGGIVVMDSLDTLIGGPDAAQRNIISANGVGILLTTGAARTVVQNNYIGTGQDGTRDLGNTWEGIVVFWNAADNQILGNLIAGNGAAGIRIEEWPERTLVQGNTVGLDSNGALLSNATGIQIISASNNTIGGSSIKQGNRIADISSGVHVVSGTGNAVSGNQFTVPVMAIDLGEAGPTPNDPGDADSGANALQNTPVLNWATLVDDPTSPFPGPDLIIGGALDSAPDTTFSLEFYTAPSCDPNTANTYTPIATRSVTADAGGSVSFREVFESPLNLSSYLMATATDPSGNTSEFSTCVPVGEAPAAPSDLRGLLATQTSITLMWQDNSTDETQFVIERSDNDQIWVEVGRVGADQTTFEDSYNLTCYIFYYYRVRAFRQLDEVYSSYSEVLYTRTDGCDQAINGSFEINVDGDTVPDGWLATRWTSRDGQTCTVAHSGQCSVQVTGGSGDKQIAQSLNLTGPAGDWFLFRFWERTEKGTPNGISYAYVIFHYTDGTSQVMPISFLTSGDHGWTEHASNVMAEKPYSQIEIVLTYDERGTVWFDDVELILHPLPPMVIILQ